MANPGTGNATAWGDEAATGAALQKPVKPMTWQVQWLIYPYFLVYMEMPVP